MSCTTQHSTFRTERVGDKDGGSQYICFLFPFWMDKLVPLYSVSVSLEICVNLIKWHSCVDTHRLHSTLRAGKYLLRYLSICNVCDPENNTFTSSQSNVCGKECVVYHLWPQCTVCNCDFSLFNRNLSLGAKAEVATDKHITYLDMTTRQELIDLLNGTRNQAV